jgi:hypothetical protein
MTDDISDGGTTSFFDVSILKLAGGASGSRICLQQTMIFTMHGPPRYSSSCSSSSWKSFTPYFEDEDEHDDEDDKKKKDDENAL